MVGLPALQLVLAGLVVLQLVLATLAEMEWTVVESSVM
jgi:hypothetical protein